MRPVNLRAARRYVQRDQSFRWRRNRPRPLAALGALLLGAALAALAWWPSLIGKAVAAVQREAGVVLIELELHGAAQIDSATVQDALDLVPGMPLLTFDLHDARARLEALGWVEAATVRRQLPGRLVIEVKEHRPLAVWLGPEGPALVAASGKPVPTDALADYLQLPRLVGATAPAAAPALLRALQGHPNLLARLERLDYLPSDRWRLWFAPGIRVELAPGEAGPQLTRLGRLVTEHDLFGRAVGAVDLRLADRVVLTPWPLVRTAAAPGGGA